VLIATAGADPAVGAGGAQASYHCRDNGAPPNFYRHERDGVGALEVEDELSALFYKFLDPPLRYRPINLAFIVRRSTPMC
jgi:hypothetical protein